MKPFSKIIREFMFLTVFAKSSIFDSCWIVNAHLTFSKKVTSDKSGQSSAALIFSLLKI